MTRLLVLLSVLLMAGCQSLRTVGTADTPASLSQLSQWNISGRLGYRAGDEGGSASVDWRQRGDSGSMHLSGPLGFGSAEIQWAPGEASLTDGKDTVRSADTASLAWRLTGLWLPVEALTYWVRGMPFPHTEFDAGNDDRGQLATLEQLGWSLQFDRYDDIGNGLLAPHKIRASRENQRFTLVIQRWEPLPFSPFRF